MGANCHQSDELIQELLGAWRPKALLGRPTSILLTFKILSDIIINKFPNLNPSLFYLDDDIVVGNISEVKLTLGTILQVSSNLCIEINIRKC